MGVLLFHYGTSYYPFSQPLLKTLIDHSSFRVSFFFFISGFILTLVYQQRTESLSPAFFYKKRLTRILPVYWLAFFVTLILVVVVKGAGPKGLVIILHALGLQSWNPGYVLDLNFTTWSISVELFFYALFPFLFNALRKLSLPKLLELCLLIYLLQSLQHFLFVNYLSNGEKARQEFISTFPVWHLGTFVIGLFSARLIAFGTFAEYFKKGSLPIFLSVLALILTLLYLPNPFLKYIHNGLLSPLFLLMVLSLYYDSTWLSRILSQPALSRLGDLSYGIFVFQYPLWLTFSAIFPERIQATSLFFLAYVLSVLLISHLVNWYFEKPVLSRLRRHYRIS